jgi:hypothetical protein
MAKVLMTNSGRSLSPRARRVLHVTPWVIYALVIPLGKLVIAVVADRTRLVSLYVDDAFYYFRVAHNIASGAGSTFDGIDLTNGYHPLWQLLLVPLFAGGPRSLTALVYVAVLQGVIWAAAILIVYRLARRTQRSHWLC